MAGMSSSSKIVLLLWVVCHSITGCLQGKNGMEKTDRRLSKEGDAVVCTEATPRPTVKLSADLSFGDPLTSGIQWLKVICEGSHREAWNSLVPQFGGK